MVSQDGNELKTFVTPHRVCLQENVVQGQMAYIMHNKHHMCLLKHGNRFLVLMFMGYTGLCVFQSLHHRY